jgi:hypothetical protein
LKLKFNVQRHQCPKIRLARKLCPGGGKKPNACHGVDIVLYDLAIQMGSLSRTGTIQSKFQKDNQE